MGRVAIQVVEQAGVDVDVLVDKLVRAAGAKDHRTYDMALAILHEEVEHEAWFSEYLSEGPSGHFRRAKPGASPYVRRFMTADFD